MTRKSWLLLSLAVLLGAAIGLGVYTFGYARGYAYLTNDPAACANCHVMQEHLTSWMKGSHRAVATCNDCHTPHNFVGKYATTASNGVWHSFSFTTGNFPDPLRITERNHRVTEKACRHCHEEITGAIEHGGERRAGDFSCVRCHKYVGHWVR